MPDLVIRRALQEELDEINLIRRQVCDVHVNGCPDIFRADG